MSGMCVQLFVQRLAVRTIISSTVCTLSHWHLAHWTPTSLWLRPLFFLLFHRKVTSATKMDNRRNIISASYHPAAHCQSREIGGKNLALHPTEMSDVTYSA